MPIKIMFFTDVHLADNSPPTRTGSYMEDILAKLKWILYTKAKDTKADATICGGDLFHIKAPSKTSHALVSRVQTLFNSAPTCGKNLCLPGNHDLMQDRIESIPSQPIGVLYNGTLSNILTPVEIQGKNGEVARVQGVPFSEVPNWEEYKLPEELINQEGLINILVVHQYFSEKPGQIHKAPIYAYEELEHLGYDLYLYGHYHVDQGVTEHEVGGRKVLHVNIGSLSRGGYGDESIKRKPKCALLSVGWVDGTKVLEHKTFEVPCRKPEDVFDLEYKTLEIEHNEKLDSFVNALETSAIMADDSSGQTVEEEIQSLEGQGETPPEVMRMVKTFLEEAAESLKGLRS